MSNAKDLVGEENPSILIFGDSGTWKTRFLSQVPGIWIADFDKGMAVSRGMDVSYDTFKDTPKAAKKILTRDGIYEYGKAWPAFIKKLNEVGERIDKGERIPIGLDSLTTMANVCMNYVLDSAGHQGAPQIQHWGAQIQLLETVMDQLTAWPVPVLVTAHVQRNTNDLTQLVEMLPLVTGKFAGKISVYFDEVYKTNVKGNGKDRTFTFQTSSDAMAKQVKTRYNVPDGTEINWAKVSDHIAKAA